LTKQLDELKILNEKLKVLSAYVVHASRAQCVLAFTSVRKTRLLDSEISNGAKKRIIYTFFTAKSTQKCVDIGR